MASFKVKTKIVLIVGASVAVVFAVVALFNGRQQSRTLEGLYTTSSHELSWAISKQIQEIMIYGDNEKLQPLTEEIVSKGLLREATVINADRLVRRSSDQTLLDKPAADTLWKTLFASGQDTVLTDEQGGEPIQVTYHLLTNEPSCVDCHDVPPGAVLGGLKMVRSTSVLAEATNANLILILLFSVGGVLVLVTTIQIALSRMIFRPIQVVKTKLAAAAAGEMDQDIQARSNDEIGQLLAAIQNLIEYVRGLSNVAGRVATGDLSAEVVPRSERDVLGTSFRTMIEYLRGMIHELSDHSRQLAGAANQIASASEEMSRGIKDQSGRIDKVTGQVESMVGTIVDSTRNAGDARDLARNAAGTATSGGQIVGDTIQGMQRIAEVVRESAGSVERLSEAAEKIGEVVRVIDDIADQTNLLALNAAIEAARAGEQGRGFAVVADEVRKLAERTAKSTGEVNQMIRDIQTRTADAVRSMETGIHEVDQGRQLADRAGTGLGEIVTMAQKVEAVISEIAGASEQQAVTAQQIAENVEQIATVTKENASGAEQSAAAAEELSRQAESLRNMVGRFKVQN